MANAKTYAGLARAPFLLLPVTLVICGAGAAAYEGMFHWGPTILARITREELCGVDRIFLINSLRGWMPAVF